jgi:hypothetical protein
VNDACRPKGWDVASNANRYQTRVSLRKVHTRPMPYPRIRRSVSSSALPRATPARRHRQVELKLGSMPHTLDCGYVLLNCQ